MAISSPGLPLRRRLLAVLGAAWALPMHAQGTADLELISAAEGGDTIAVKRLLDSGAGVTARDGRRRTALMAATQGNHVEATRLLVDKGADVNAQDSIEDSPFLLAGASGFLEILKMCLAHGADLKSRNRYGGTALIPACHHGHLETVRELLKTKIDVNHVNKLGWTALLEAIILGDGGKTHTEIVRELLAHGAQANLADRDGVTPLGHARRHGYREMVRLLEAAGGR
jgi:ankyrin repeat protein